MVSASFRLECLFFFVENVPARKNMGPIMIYKYVRPEEKKVPTLLDLGETVTVSEFGCD